MPDATQRRERLPLPPDPGALGQPRRDDMDIREVYPQVGGQIDQVLCGELGPGT
jgi:hypothetical protein